MLKSEFLYHSAEFEYPGYFRRKSICDLEVYHRSDGVYIAIATEMSYNPGTSVTNCSESIASMVLQQYELLPNQLIFVERYDIRSYNAPNTQSRTAIHTFEWDGGTAKHPKIIPCNFFEQLLGGLEL